MNIVLDSNFLVFLLLCTLHSIYYFSRNIFFGYWLPFGDRCFSTTTAAQCTNVPRRMPDSGEQKKIQQKTERHQRTTDSMDDEAVAGQTNAHASACNKKTRTHNNKQKDEEEKKNIIRMYLSIWYESDTQRRRSGSNVA